MKNPADTVDRGSSYKSWDNGLWTQTLTVKEEIVLYWFIRKYIQNTKVNIFCRLPREAD